MVKSVIPVFKNKKKLDIIEFILLFGIVVLMNFILSQYFFRIDLTEDKRYSISDASKDILKNLNDVVYVEVYLTGDLPADYKRLEKSAKEMLDEFRVYAGEKLQYKFFDPNQEQDEQRKSRIYQYLASKGIRPTSIATQDGEKYIFPAAQLVYKEQEAPIVLLKGSTTEGEAEMVNQSVESLEYQFISAIRQLSGKNKKSIAFIEGHGELPAINTSDIAGSLSKYYNVYRINLNQVKDLSNYEAIVIAKPMTAYSETEKFVLDQYILKGGKALFFIDPVHVSMDSINENGTVGVPVEYNLDDMLFKYGLRMNVDLIQDMQATLIPMYVGEMGDRPQVRMVPWMYYPLMNNFADHPTAKNTDVIYSRFVSTIDTVKAPGVNKIPLLFTSKYTKVFSSPLKVDLNDARKQNNPEEFTKGSLPVAFLLEGIFTSLYKNRPKPIVTENFVEQGRNCQIFVCSDGDIIKNEIARRKQQIQEVPLQGGNKDFVTNIVDYMLDEQGLINVRGKEIALRPLDKIKVREDKTFWQVVNLALPIGLVVVFGIVRFYLRKKKYQRF